MILLALERNKHVCKKLRSTQNTNANNIYKFENSENYLKNDLQSLLGDVTLSKEDVAKIVDEIMQRKEILENHNHAIWQGKNGKWNTYVDDATKSKGRRLVSLKNRSDIENLIVNEYLSKSLDNITFEELFYKWLREYQPNHSSNGNAIRLLNSYKKFYKDTWFTQKKVKEISLLDSDNFVHETIKKFSLNSKQKDNMKTIMNQILDYAIRLKLVEVNVARSVRVASNTLAPITPKPSQQEVFYEDEMPLVMSTLREMAPIYKDSRPYLLMFMFYLGIRVGEAVAIMEKDIVGDELCMCHEEVIEKIFDDDFNSKGTIHTIVDHTKTKKGNRLIPLTPKALEVIALARKFKKQKGIESEFLFVNENGRHIYKESVNDTLYDCCQKISTYKKSSHKIRKTTISSMIDNGMNPTSIINIVGHKEYSTTLNSYCRERKHKESIKNELAMATNW